MSLERHEKGTDGGGMRHLSGLLCFSHVAERTQKTQGCDAGRRVQVRGDVRQWIRTVHESWGHERLVWASQRPMGIAG